MAIAYELYGRADCAAEMTAEERRNTMPDTGNEDTVFAGGSESYSIGEITDETGKTYGRGVRLDSTLLENLTDSERVQMVKERVRELGGQYFTAFDGNGNKIDILIAKPNARFVNKSKKSIPVNKDLTTKNRNLKIKQEAVVLADELIATARHEKDSAARYPHGWLDDNGKNDWAEWKTYIQDKENTVWEATLHVATSTDGEKVLYDIDPIKKTGQSGNSDTSTAKSIVAENGRPVKQQFSISGDKQEIVRNLRGILDRGGSATELRRYVETLEEGKIDLPTYGETEAAGIVRSAHNSGMSVDEYLRQNWERYEYEGEMNEAARRALELEKQQSRRRYSVSETRDTLPAKARTYLARTERTLLEKVSETLSVPYFAKREYLQDIVREISDEYLREGAVKQETVDRLFDTAYDQGVVVDDEYYRQYKDVKDRLRTQAVTISEQDKHDIADWGDFRKSAWRTES